MKNIPLFNKSKCMYCGACVGVCPKLALVLKETEVVLDKDKCISCASCEKACPLGAIRMSEK